MPTSGTLGGKTFSYYTASMVLSFCAIESFSASVAFSMPREERYADFDFGKYRNTWRFWDKIDLIFSAIPYVVDKSQGLFQRVGEMQDWRNLVAHSSPYEIERTVVSSDVNASLKLHEPFRKKEYTRRVEIVSAKQFYSTAVEYVALLSELTGITPHASATHIVGECDV